MEYVISHQHDFISQQTESSFFFAEFAGWATGENSPSTIPWDEVVEHPDRYVDALLYKLPCSLNAPEVLKSIPHHIFSLHEFFLVSSSTSLPFRFRSKQEITKEISSVIGDELDISDGEAPSPLNALFLMSPATTVSTPHPTIPPSPAHCSGTLCSSPSNSSPFESETPQPSANPHAEPSVIEGELLDNNDSETPPDGDSFPMSPRPATTATRTVSTLPAPPLPSPPSPAHRSGATYSPPSNNSPLNSDTPQPTPNPDPASGLDPPIADPSTIANSGLKVMATSPSEGVTGIPAKPPMAGTRGTGKKGLGCTKKRSASARKVGGLPKNAKAVEDAQPSNSITGNSPQVEPHASTRKSRRAADLKRKQAEREGVTTSEQSEPAKKRRLHERWFYVPVIPVANPASQP